MVHITNSVLKGVLQISPEQPAELQFLLFRMGEALRQINPGPKSPEIVNTQSKIIVAAERNPIQATSRTITK